MSHVRLARILALFAVVYGVLLAPWPGGRESYARFFRAFAGAAYAREGPPLVRFRKSERPPRPVIDTEIVLSQDVPPDAQGNVPARLLGLDTRGVGWVPTALLTALIVATPVGWSRRLRSLVIGLLLIHAYLLAVVGAYLWNESAGAVPATFLPYSAALGNFLEETLVTQLGPSFVVPVVIWLGLFVRSDFPRIVESFWRRPAEIPAADQNLALQPARRRRH